jgi:AcrR family transcriptional regulator
MIMNDNYPLRERKHAQTKIDLAKAFLKELYEFGFHNVSIKKVCQMANVSEGTFFNYFPKKEDILCYAMRMSALKTIQDVKSKANKLNTINLIMEVFKNMFKEMPIKVFYEMTSVLISKRRTPKETPPLSKLEKHYAFGNDDISNMEESTIEEIFLFIIEKGIEKKELSKSINPKDIVLSLFSILIGVPFSQKFEDYNQMHKVYKKQVELLIKGAGSK